MSFTTTKLVNNRVLVQGTDIAGAAGKTILDATQWNELHAHEGYTEATEAFEAAVEQFFAPLMAAADKMAAAMERPTDSLGYVVLQERVDATPGQPEKLVKLTHDSMILRLIEQGDTDRLVWVGDALEIAESTTAAAVATVADVLGGSVESVSDSGTEQPQG